MAEAYLSFSEDMKTRFGNKVYKLSLDGGMTCPTRDGKLDTRGCVFCSAKGSGDFASSYCEDIPLQLERAKARISSKLSAKKDVKYLVYFQSFTNTYGPIDHLRKIFMEAIAPEDVVGISVATRPDCLGEDVLALLSDLGKIKPLWVELGLQSIHRESIAYMRRGYENAVFERAVENLHGIGALVVAHMILGLPHETKDMMVETAQYVGKLRLDGVKLQLLHVLDGTDLGEDFKNGKISVLEKDAYFAILADCIRHLPPEMVIHRLTGDGAKRELLAPSWSGDKKRVLNDMRRYFEEINLQQGSLWRKV